MERISEAEGCPFFKDGDDEGAIVLSTNWEYLDTMKMNPEAPAPNMVRVTQPNMQSEGKNFVPWFWPDDELAQAVKIRQANYLANPDSVFLIKNDKGAVREASLELLHHQANYLKDHFPDKYTIGRSRKFGEIIINKVTDDQFCLEPKKNDWHPLAISGMLTQEDICIVRRRKSGRQVFIAGFVATPTNWELSDFLGADMDNVHKHVTGYHEPAHPNRQFRLKETVDRTLESLHEYPDRIIARNNMFAEYNPLLSLPTGTVRPYTNREVKEDPTHRILLRSERETLTRLPAPYNDFSIFTIKPHVFKLSDVRDHRGADFIRAIDSNTEIQSMLTHRKYDFKQDLRNYLAEESIT